jgi:Na+/H+ antiporter NhaD/arsenite permease-like protein
MIAAQTVVLLIFVLSFTLILSEKMHRAVAAWLGCIMMLFFGHITNVFTLGEGSSLEHEMLSWIEFEVIGLLLGMMIFAALLEVSGFFEFVAIKASKLSKGDPWRLIVYLGTLTTVLSLVIDNVTAIIIIAPITLRICKKMGISPIPPLLAEAILSDTGGVASMVGDPPNVMIAAAAHDVNLEHLFGFNGFLLRLGFLTLIAWIITLGYLRWYYRNWISEKPESIESLMKEDEWAVIDNLRLMKTTLLILSLTVVGFSLTEFLHLPIQIHAIALSGAGFALVFARPMPDYEHDEGFLNDVIGRVEWQALLFFAGLFMLVGALGNVGYLESLAIWIFASFGSDPVMLAVAVVWVSAIASAIIDNIPFTAAMIPVIISIGEANPGIDIAPLFWALAMGAGFGGNATPIGSSANVMTVSISERGEQPITTREWMRVGLPVMLMTCVVATIFIIIFHGVLYSSI